jgi:hypothetical protein
VRTSAKPPAWLFAATGLLAVAILVMAVAETSLWKHYLIDGGEWFSIGGLVFILLAGLYVHRQGRLFVSLPLIFPWLLFPVITQGDQLIDNLSINQMRLIVHILLAAIFAMPVAVIVLGLRYGVPAVIGSRYRAGMLAALLFTLEMWVAYQFLGWLMIATLAIMIAAAMAYALWPERHAAGRATSERFALVVLLGGVAVSFALYVGYKNRPGAYQGSPAYYMDPTQADAAYQLDLVKPGTVQPVTPAAALAAGQALSGYGRALEQLLDGYYIADRNYNYAYHNALFLRNTPVLPDFRRVALDRAHEAARTARAADENAHGASLPIDDGLGALLEDVGQYTAFNIRRSMMLERMSGEFEQTQAGLQHATHLYEGEGKVLGVRLMDILAKHHQAVGSSALAPVVTDFMTRARNVHDKYANRIVGF